MKRLLLISLAVLLFTNVCVNAQGNMIVEQYNEMEFDELFYAASQNFPEFNGKKIVEMLSQGTAFESKKIFDIILDFVFKNTKTLAKTFVLITITGYLISVLHTTSEAFGGGSSQISFLVGYCIFSGILVSVFAEIISPAKETIQTLVTMIKAVIPTLLTLMTFSGGVNTSLLMSSVLISMINVISLILGNFLLNTVMTSVALSVADKMSDKINITSAIKSLKQFVKWILLFCMAVYSGVYGVYGLAGSALDSRIGKATRFAVGSSVPIVGGVVSDSIEVILGTVGAVRSITGVVGIIAICAVALYPIIKTALVMWLLRLCAAILEPVSDKRIVQLTTDVADSVSVIFAILISVSLLFIGCVGIILISGNFIS